MSDLNYLLSISLIFGTILIVFGMKYFSAAYRARTEAVGKDAYRELAEKAIAEQSQNAASLSAMRSELAEVKSHLAAVEKILKTVE